MSQLRLFKQTQQTKKKKDCAIFQRIAQDKIVGKTDHQPINLVYSAYCIINLGVDLSSVETTSWEASASKGGKWCFNDCNGTDNEEKREEPLGASVNRWQMVLVKCGYASRVFFITLVLLLSLSFIFHFIQLLFYDDYHLFIFIINMNYFTVKFELINKYRDYTRNSLIRYEYWDLNNWVRVFNFMNRFN